MNIETIKKQLETFDKTFPEAAVRAAMEQREAITPILLDCLRTAADDPQRVAAIPGAMLHIYAMYLLAQFQERAAYPLLVKLFSTPGEVCFDLAGDVVTEDLDRILIAVCGGDLEPIKRMIEDPTVNEYVRSSCMRSLVTLVLRGDLERESAIDYFRTLFTDKLSREPGFVWGSLIIDCCDLCPEELLPEIERAFADGLVDTFLIGLDSVEQSIAEGREAAMQLGRRSRRGPITDTVAEIQCWACFDEEESPAAPLMPPMPPMETDDLPRTTKGGSPPPTPTVVRSTPAGYEKVGRNDPCPCGSGKKYKKCCLH